MFTLSLCVEQPGPLCGLEALDFRRKWKLPDDSIWLSHGFVDKKFSETVDVSEAFARANFPRSIGQYHLTVPLDMLAAHEVYPANPRGEGLIFSCCPTPERAAELFHAVERRRLMTRIAELEALVATLPESE